MFHNGDMVHYRYQQGVQCKNIKNEFQVCKIVQIYIDSSVDECIPVDSP